MLTTILAIYGAVLSTLVFIWSIWKWHRDNPHIVAKVEGYENPLGGGIAFEIRNRGRRPTTIEQISLVRYEEGFLNRFLHLYGESENVSVKYRKTAKLPIVLQPGEVWKGTAPFPEEKSGLRGIDNMPELIRAGGLHFKIQCAHTDRRLSGTVKPESFTGL